MREKNKKRLYRGLAVVLIVAIIALPLWSFASSLGGYIYKTADTGHDEYFEQQCNERFGYEWEYHYWDKKPEDGIGEWRIQCYKNMGLFAVTQEWINVTVEVGQ